VEDASRLEKTVARLKGDIADFTAQQREKARQEAEAAGGDSRRNPFLDIDLENITEKQREDAQKSGLDLADPKYVH
jgi:hypothetical protein